MGFACLPQASRSSLGSSDHLSGDSDVSWTAPPIARRWLNGSTHSLKRQLFASKQGIALRWVLVDRTGLEPGCHRVRQTLCSTDPFLYFYWKLSNWSPFQLEDYQRGSAGSKEIYRGLVKKQCGINHSFDLVTSDSGAQHPQLSRMPARLFCWLVFWSHLWF